MDESNQIEPPPSFTALYSDRYGRLRERPQQVIARYELCEDLASHLVGQAEMLYHGPVPSEAEVLLRMHAGLAQPGSAVSPAEAHWVTQRLSELLQWPCPALPPLPDEPAPSF